MFLYAVLLVMGLASLASTVSAADATTVRLDRNLQNWLDTLLHNGQPRDMDKGTSDADLAAQETISDYLRLRRTHTSKIKEDISSAFLQKLQKQQVEHPLTPYFLEEAYELDKFQQLFQLHNFTHWFPSRSCPARHVLREILASKEKLTPNELRQTMPWIAALHERRFKYHAFLKILRILHKNKKQLPADLLPHLRDFPNLKIAFQNIMPRVPVAVDARIAYLLHDKKCGAAYALLRGSKIALPKFKELALRIAKCYRRHRRFSQLKFWRNLRTLMQKQHNFAGWAAATIRMAELHRYRDRFYKATSLLQQVQKKAIKHGASAVLDRTLFALAQVKEHQRRFGAATRLYQQHTVQFPQSQHHDIALKSLALLLISDAQWEQAETVLARLQQRQDTLPRDARLESMLGFALLWQGRIAMEMNNLDAAKAAWSRLQREFFSSYHGALAHYMLEKISGRSILIAPAAKAVFEERMLYDPFDRQVQVQVARSLYLLRLGMSKEAVCEIREQPAIGNGQMYVKALLSYAAGDWAEAIKTFTAIDRSYRELLPLGSEMILFPKRFETEIFTYARRAEIDPLLAMALIRQESIFNPRALSPADARGLMQIMPRTARYEATRLKKSYISAHEKKRIKRVVRSSRNNLYDVSTNLLLGVHYLQRLLDKYKNTVHTLSSYNAGTTPVNRWLKDFSSEDSLLFVAKIPWKETRNYVKLVLRNYFYYKRWYGDNESEEHNYLDPVVRVALRLP